MLAFTAHHSQGGVLGAVAGGCAGWVAPVAGSPEDLAQLFWVRGYEWGQEMRQIVWFLSFERC